MTTEQNEPQASQGASQGGSQAEPQTAQAQQRRRRRRRKTGKGPGAQGNPAAGVAPVQNGEAIESPAPPSIQVPRGSAGGSPAGQSNGGQNNGSQNGGEGRRQGGRPPHSKKQRPQQNSAGQPSNGSNNGSSNGQGNGNGSSNQGRQFQKSSPHSNNGYQNNSNGGGQGNGNNARRKVKQRRPAPSFVGPMDHSYRVANGNIADGSPSTMDFRNGNANGNIHGRNGYSDMGEPVPAALREDLPVRIVCFIEDLFVLAKIQETARKLGVKVNFAKAEKDTLAKLTEMPESDRPSLIVFDLNNVNAKPLTLIPKIKAKLKRGTSVIGFLSHLQGDLKVKAIEAGCDMVMPKSAFSQNLPNLLRRHGLEEEEFETVEANHA